MSRRLFNMPLKTFNPANLLEEMLQAKDGDMFVLGEKNIATQIGEYRVELTVARITKIIDEPKPTAMAAPKLDKLKGEVR